MKASTILLTATLFLTTLTTSFAQTLFEDMAIKSKPRVEKAEITWSVSMKHDFGDIAQDIPVIHKFEFTNDSDKPMVLDNVRTTCGCAAPTWTHDPILPGETSIIEIEYNAAKEGGFVKFIKVFINGVKKPEILTITGDVIPSPVSEADRMIDGQ